MIGSIVFMFFETLVVFIFSLLMSILTKQKIKTFTEIWEGPNTDEFIDNVGYEMKLILIGFISILFIAWRLTNFYLPL